VETTAKTNEQRAILATGAIVAGASPMAGLSGVDEHED
jgi:hypothetical protein